MIKQGRVHSLLVRHWRISGHYGSRFSHKLLQCHLELPTSDTPLKRSLQLECAVCFLQCVCVMCAGRPPGDSSDSWVLLSSSLVSEGWYKLSQRQNRPPTSPQYENKQATQPDVNKVHTTPRSQCAKIKTGESSLMRPEVRTKLQVSHIAEFYC